MTFWHAVRFLHLLAMAFFVGGQLVLVAAVVPTVGHGRNPAAMRGIARRFGWGSVVAIAVLVITGAAMAGEYDRWGDGTLHAKLALVVLVGALVVWHIKAPQRPALDGAIFVASLVIVWLGVALAH
jgi:uncharacterized membrane protein